jgi:hypothetical protein
MKMTPLRVRDLQPLDTILIVMADYANTGVIPPISAAAMNSD